MKPKSCPPVNRLGFYLFFLLLIGLGSQPLCAQTTISGTINTYTEVSALSTPLNFVTVASNAGFSVGDRVVLIQMQGASVNHSNTASYGSITSLGEAGNYEMNRICEILGNDIYLEDSLAHSFAPGNGVQLVRVLEFGRVEVVGNLQAQAWNGSTGGVLALSADTLVLSANLLANAAGFRGGAVSVNFFNPSLCTQTDFFFPFANGFSGFKGESIALATVGEETGRGAYANGGGGGNHTNSGGGGGSHATAGGLGGVEWQGCSAVSIGGLAGFSLAYAPGTDRLYLGGGGGGGHQNNSASTPGGNGGGIVLIEADHLISNAASIQANGGSLGLGPLSAIDGGGGGGAGGAIFLQVNSFAGNLDLQAQGGQGGLVSDNHGPGAGGSGGVLLFSQPALPAGITTNLSGGNSGVDGLGLNRGAQPGSAGILQFSRNLATGGNSVPACPIVLDAEAEILYGQWQHEGFRLSWEGDPETEISLWRSHGASLTELEARSPTRIRQSPSENGTWLDQGADLPEGSVTAYHLRLQNANGDVTESNRVYARWEGIPEWKVVNPVRENQLELMPPKNTPENLRVRIYNLAGQIVQEIQVGTPSQTPNQSPNPRTSNFPIQVQLNTGLSSGLYLLEVSGGQTRFLEKIWIQP